MTAVELGERYRDSASGYEGCATARAEYLGDAPSVRLTRLDGSGDLDEKGIPEGRLVPVDDGSAVGFR